MTKIFSFILIIFLILQLSFSQEEFCKIDQNNLIVPKSGCTLNYSEETLVKDIKLLGELKINRRNHLKYENIKAESEDAQITITSNYERIVIEDLQTDQCDIENLQTKINLNFASSSKNELFDIEYVELNTYKAVNRLPNLLYKGAQVIIFNEYEMKLTKIKSVKGENIILYDELQQKESYIQWIASNDSLSKVYHQLLLFDDKRIIFKNNCLRISSNLKPSKGAIFLNQRGLKYESDLGKGFNLSDIIVYDDDKVISPNQSNIEIKAIMQNIILMGKRQSYQFNTQEAISRLLIIHQLMQTFTFTDPQKKGKVNGLYDFKIYGSKGKILIPKGIDVKGIIIANSEIEFEAMNIQPIQHTPTLNFENGVLKQTKTDKWITPFLLLRNMYIQSEINVQTPSIQIQLLMYNCIFDGTGLEGAIRQSLKNAYYYIILNEVQFIRFEKAKYPLFYSLVDKDSLTNQETFGPFTSEIYSQIHMHQSTFAFDISKSFFTNLQNLKFETDFFPVAGCVTIQNEELYSQKNIIRYKNPFFSEKELTLSFQPIALQFSMKNGDKLYDIIIEIQDGKTSLKFDELIYIYSDYEYKIYFKLKENQSASTSEELQINTGLGTIGHQKIKIFFDSQQPILKISENDKFYSFNQLDRSIELNLYEDFSRKILTFSFCKKGEVIQNNLCQSSCSDKTINPYQGVCFDKTKSYPRYYQTKDQDNKAHLNSCSWYCDDCKDSSSCNECTKNVQQNNCKDLKLGQFIDQNEEIGQCFKNCLNCDSAETCNKCDQNMVVFNNSICKTLSNSENFSNQQIENCSDQCKQCFSKQYCSECKDGYQLILGQCIQQCGPSLYFSLENGECEKCKTGEKKCETSKNKTCLAGYKLQGFECVKSDEIEPRVCDGVSCYTCSKQSDKSCQHPYPFICDQGQFYSFGQQKCLQCNQNCEECENNANQCTSCAKDQFLVNGICSQCPEQYIQINNVCEKCPGGYFSKKGENQCYKCDSKCKECEQDANQCTSCSQEYILMNGTCSQCPENQIIDDNNKCQKCSDGYFLKKGENQCQKCDSKCKECQQDAKQCTSCAQEYVLINGSCSQCPEKHIIVDNTCQKCKDGYFSKKGENQCYKCDSKCKECEQEANQCTSCAQDYILMNGTCSQCPENHIIVNNKCQKCSDGYFLKNGENQCQKCDPKCKECEQDENQCTSCAQDYILMNGTCSQCSENHIIVNNKCQKCSDGYFLKNGENQCQKCDSKCKECQQDAKQCTSCAQEYVLINGSCSQCPEKHIIVDNTCQKCQDGYFSKKGENQCYKCDSKCKECEQEANQCTSCAQDYILMNGTCSQCPENHIIVNNLCQKCSDGYFSKKGENQCQKCDSKCKECKQDANQCTSCTQKYFLIKGVCSQCPEQHVKINNICQKCPDGQFSNIGENKCKQCNSKCKKCENNANQCTSCAQDQTLVNGICIKCPETHIIINNVCQICPEGYFSKKGENKCYQCDPKCKECITSSDNCISCNQYQYLENNVCFPCNENCKECKNSTFCISCTSDDYQLSNGTCIKVAEAESGLDEGQIIGIIFGSIFGVLTIGFVINLVRIRQVKNSKNLIKSSIQNDDVNLMAKNCKQQIEINIPVQTIQSNNIQTLLSLDTQQILKEKETKNEIFQTITSI